MRQVGITTKSAYARQSEDLIKSPITADSPAFTRKHSEADKRAGDFCRFVRTKDIRNESTVLIAVARSDGSMKTFHIQEGKNRNLPPGIIGEMIDDEDREKRAIEKAKAAALAKLRKT